MDFTQKLVFSHSYFRAFSWVRDGDRGELRGELRGGRHPAHPRALTSIPWDRQGCPRDSLDFLSLAGDLQDCNPETNIPL